MTTAPDFLKDALRRFGATMGLENLALSDRGTVGFKFEGGLSARFEYAFGTLSVMMLLPCEARPERMARLLERAHHGARRSFRLRTGYFAKSGAAFFATRLKETDVTLPVLQGVWNTLWAEAKDFGGAE